MTVRHQFNPARFFGLTVYRQVRYSDFYFTPPNVYDLHAILLRHDLHPVAFRQRRFDGFDLLWRECPLFLRHYCTALPANHTVTLSAVMLGVHVTVGASPVLSMAKDPSP